MTAPLQTRAQRDLKRAVDLIEEFKKRESAQDVRDNFTRRAKQFPALVMQVGLAQALAFSVEKAKKEGAVGKAHGELLRQVGEVLEQRDVIQAVHDAPASEYMHLTRRLLDAWNYHRRFAVTILGEPKGNENED